MSCLPENQHLGRVRVAFLGDFSSLNAKNISLNNLKLISSIVDLEKIYHLCIYESSQQISPAPTQLTNWVV